MPEPSSWSRAEEYIRETIKRLGDNDEKLENRFSEIQIEMAVIKARGYFWPSVIASTFAGFIILLLELLSRI